MNFVLVESESEYRIKTRVTYSGFAFFFKRSTARLAARFDFITCPAAAATATAAKSFAFFDIDTSIVTNVGNLEIGHGNGNSDSKVLQAHAGNADMSKARVQISVGAPLSAGGHFAYSQH